MVIWLLHSFNIDALDFLSVISSSHSIREIHLSVVAACHWEFPQESLHRTLGSLAPLSHTPQLMSFLYMLSPKCACDCYCVVAFETQKVWDEKYLIKVDCWGKIWSYQDWFWIKSMFSELDCYWNFISTPENIIIPGWTFLPFVSCFVCCSLK